MEKKKIKLEEIMPTVEEKLASGGTVKIGITGTSMLPLLVWGRDKVVLKKAEKRLKKHDIPLYRRSDGTFVLHRIIAVNDGFYTMCGDNQWVKEDGITDAQIIGVVCEIERKGKIISTESLKYKFYCQIWYALFPVRKYIVKIRGKLKK